MSDIRVVLIGGRAGSGKSTVGAELSKLTGYSLYDKDTIANPLSEELLIALNSHADDRESAIYLGKVRPLEYRSMRAAVLENVALGNSAIMVAPFGPEFRNSEWLKLLQMDCDRAAAEPVGVCAVQLSVRDEILKQRLELRQLPRDLDKLARWESFVDAQAGAPADSVFTMDVSDCKPHECARQLCKKLLIAPDRIR